MSLHHLLKLNTFLSILLAIFGCNFDDERRPQQKSASNDQSRAGAFAVLKEKVFDAQCARCHNPGRSSGGVDLTTWDTITTRRSAKGERLIVAGDPAASLVVQVVISGRMPPRGPLEVKMIELLQCWVRDGATEAGGSECVSPSIDDQTLSEDDKSKTKPKPPIPPTQEPVRFKQVYAQILDVECTRCHSGNEPAEGIDLSTYEKVMQAVGVFGDNNAAPKTQLIVPAQPEQSLLWNVIQANRMPIYADSLSEENKQLVRQWIVEGANP